ncbi:gluconokinase [Microbacterium sp. AZCO]|uniref:gluconokinase n=1 Tax=Microbacterium sp. AZCO TaxID=3142976 RepID=UPI0031F41AE4
MTGRVVVMGPSGSGKSLVGAALAERVGAAFVDADDLHPEVNLVKMARGIPLDDADRMPWLDAVARALDAADAGLVVACSALARRYRDRIRAGAPGIAFVELLVDPRELSRRMDSRDHFMPTQLLGSQLTTWEHLEPDEVGLAVRNDRSVLDVVEEALSGLERRQSLR